MSEESLHGLNCPNCGGMVPIPEGHTLVKCPYCEMRSFVKGQRGVRRYQLPLRIDRSQAIDAMSGFLKGKWAISRDAVRTARLTEAFVVYLPFWTVRARAAGWVFGEKKVGSGNDARYKPREVRVVQEMTWNGAACDVGEFGVTRVPVIESGLEPFDPEKLHSTGMVFEPVNSASDARQQAESQFHEQVGREAGLDRIGQRFVRLLKSRLEIVYHPLWVMRYLYRGRVFQVVVDGYAGKVLYGKAPGNTIYRAGVLVAGMAIGAFLAIDVTGFLLGAGGSSDDGSPFLIIVALFAAGLGIMAAAYRAFRYGEQYEYREHAPKDRTGINQAFEMITNIKDIETWTDQLP